MTDTSREAVLSPVRDTMKRPRRVRQHSIRGLTNSLDLSKEVAGLKSTQSLVIDSADYLKAAPRFWSKVQLGPCWIWQGAKDGNGYGQFSFHDKLVPAHRWSYESIVGPIPDGLFLDHLCRVPLCVNPAHLEPVTNRENVIRGFAARGKPKFCRKGHEMTEENTYARPDGTRRTCRICKKARDAQRRAQVQNAGSAA